MIEHAPQAEHQSPMAALSGHIDELRKRLIWSFIAIAFGTILAYLVKEKIYAFLVAPLEAAMGDDLGRLIYTNLPEMFFTYLSVSFFAGCFLTFPFLLLQVWAFVAPGLYANEKKVFAPYIVLTPLLFFLGGAFVYHFLMPTAWAFFLSFQSVGDDTGLPIQLEQRAQDYLDLVMTLIFVFGLSFQLPVLLTLLARAGMVGAAGLRAFRRYAIVLCFVVAAIVTPPDVISQFALALPLWGLYEISIFLVARIEKARHATAA